MDCYHDKEYSNIVLMSNPPKVIWKCKKCGGNSAEIYNAIDNRIIMENVKVEMTEK
ncbi:hypothetical protein [Bacillus luti]|uniref:hypothetical protein n=1 Tax=Bacillus luti TaxID=2026191 RepID=UPI003775714F